MSCLSADASLTLTRTEQQLPITDDIYPSNLSILLHNHIHAQTVNNLGNRAVPGLSLKNRHGR
jgi:hypothetical protein